MARNDIFRLRGTNELVLDVQALEMTIITSTVVIPLIPLDRHEVIARLQPIIEIESERYAMATQAIGSVPNRELGEIVARLDDGRHFDITDAIDLLLNGY